MRSSSPTSAMTRVTLKCSTRTFGRRVIGLRISREGDGMQFEWRPIGGGAMLVYTVGRSYLLEHFHSLMQSRLVKMTAGPMSKQAFAQLNELQAEMRESGIVYRCPPGRHDDLAMSCAMLAWAARHPHLPRWIPLPPRPRPPDREYDWKAFV